MKFFNCNNREGFDIDGTMDINEINFDNNLCKWQMVSGPSGTFLQSFDFEQDFDTSLENGDIMKNWYFDMSTPLPGVPGHLMLLSIRMHPMDFTYVQTCWTIR